MKPVVPLCAVFAVWCLASIAACTELCTAVVVASVSVTVENLGGQPINDATVTASKRDGDTKTCTAQGDSGAYDCGFTEEPGEFTVTADKEEFIAAEQTVTVADGACHVDGQQVTLVLRSTENGCCCAFIRPGDFDIISEDLAATEAECLARDAGECIDPAQRLTPHPCCPEATGDRCE